ncbi:DUF6489 family protein [Marinobacterium jannaschii]|uniref:DUF6489 family protein n=1 Tax=Marinobacterium jannaschii TaxID=64970 RepID=UPI00048381F4|nr:DUF6489 family protein [Marinobacterium jannaschii]
MKLKMDVEVTPEEVRRLLGLPDVAGLHQDMIEQIREQMASGVEGYDPLTLFKPYLSGGMGSMDALQKIMLGMMANGYQSADRESD